VYGVENVETILEWDFGFLVCAGQNSGLPRIDAPPGGRLGFARRQRRGKEFCVAFGYSGDLSLDGSKMLLGHKNLGH